VLEPLVGLLDAPAFALGVILDLVTLDFADAEIMALRMAEIEATYERARPHRKALGELDANAALAVEQAEQLLLLAVVGLRRIARRRADAAILLGNQLDIAQPLVGRIGPELGSCALVQPLRERFRQPIGERLDHDR